MIVERIGETRQLTYVIRLILDLIFFPFNADLLSPLLQYHAKFKISKKFLPGRQRKLFPKRIDSLCIYILLQAGYILELGQEICKMFAYPNHVSRTNIFILLDVILSSHHVLECSQKHILLLIEHQVILSKDIISQSSSTNHFIFLATSQKQKTNKQKTKLIF